jgi:hypothetical protein
VTAPKITYVSNGIHGMLRGHFNRIEAAANLDDRDRTFHDRRVKGLQRWIDEIDPLGPFGPPAGVQRIRLNYGMLRMMATDAEELAHVSPSAQWLADSLRELATDSRCWLETEY